MGLMGCGQLLSECGITMAAFAGCCSPNLSGCAGQLGQCASRCCLSTPSLCYSAVGRSSWVIGFFLNCLSMAASLPEHPCDAQVCAACAHFCNGWPGLCSQI